MLRTLKKTKRTYELKVKKQNWVKIYLFDTLKEALQFSMILQG